MPAHIGPTQLRSAHGAFAVLADGRLATVENDGTIPLWDLTTGAETARLEGHKAALASSLARQTPWSATLAEYNARNGPMMALAALPDGALASTTGTDQTIRLWDVNTGAQIGGAPVPRGYLALNGLLALPDGKVAVGAFATIHVLDLRAGIEVDRLTLHSSDGRAQARPATVLADGRLAVLASGVAVNSTVRLWDMRTGASTTIFDRKRPLTNRVVELPDDRLAIWSDGLRIFSLRTNTELACFRGIGGGAYAYLPSGLLVSGWSLWDLQTGDEVSWPQSQMGRIRSLAPLPDGRLVSGSEDGAVRLWDLRTDTRIGHPGGHWGDVTAVAQLPKGSLASLSRDKTIRLWDARTGAEAVRLATGMPPGRALIALPGNKLASGSDNGTVAVWSLETGTEIATLEIDEPKLDTIQALAALPDGRLASACSARKWRLGPETRLIQVPRDDSIRLWDLERGTVTGRLLGHAGWVFALALLPDGRLASGSYDRTIRLWDLHTEFEVDLLRGHTKAVWALAAMSDGRLVSGSDDKSIRLWDARSGSELACLSGHTGRVTALALVSDRLLASGSVDQTVRLWDLESGEELAVLPLGASVLSLAALPDRRLVATVKGAGMHWLDVIGERD